MPHNSVSGELYLTAEAPELESPRARAAALAAQRRKSSRSRSPPPPPRQPRAQRTAAAAAASPSFSSSAAAASSSASCLRGVLRRRGAPRTAERQVHFPEVLVTDEGFWPREDRSTTAYWSKSCDGCLLFLSEPNKELGLVWGRGFTAQPRSLSRWSAFVRTSGEGAGNRTRAIGSARGQASIPTFGGAQGCFAPPARASSLRVLPRISVWFPAASADAPIEPPLSVKAPGVTHEPCDGVPAAA